MTTKEIMKAVKEAFKTEVSSECAETMMGLESWLIGEDSFYESLKKKLDLLSERKEEAIQSSVTTRVELSTVELYDPDHKFLGEVNFYEFAAARADICDNSLKGYYIKHEGLTYFINENGRMKKWPVGVLEEYDEMLNRIILKM